MADSNIHFIVQRYRTCRILLEETEYQSVGNDEHCGMLVYISFGQNSTRSHIDQAISVLLNLPILTVGHWGDKESTTQNVIDLARSGAQKASLVLVPQANLISRLKSQGKSIQYHGQISKEEGQKHYEYFVNAMKGRILEHQCEARNQTLPDWYLKWKTANNNSTHKEGFEPSLPPESIFRDESKYSAWSDDGMPTLTVSGEALAKSSLKKLRKIRDSHSKKHEKWKLDNRDDSRDEEEAVLDTTLEWEEVLDPLFCRIVHGSFGRRQGLEFTSDMGPFCHQFSI